jgi:hypothetical protein
MPINKAHILNEIRRIARANGGKAPGSHALKSQSGIKKSDWYPHIWLRWSDALVEAGYAPNQFQSKTSDDLVMRAYIGLIRELGRVPIEGKVRRKAKSDDTFPSHTIFSRFGGKQGLIDAVADFCKRSAGFDDILAILAKVRRPSKAVFETGIGRWAKSCDRIRLSNEIRATLQDRSNKLSGTSCERACHQNSSLT